jgi:hypothetical protein
LLTEALAGHRVRSRLMSPRDPVRSVDVTIELTDVDLLGTLLGELRMISPQVFVSSAGQRPRCQRDYRAGTAEPRSVRDVDLDLTSRTPTAQGRLLTSKLSWRTA